MGFRPGYRAADFDANRDSIACTNFSTEISQTKWSDKPGGLMTIIGWFEYAIEVEPAPEAARKAIHWLALLREYWYVTVVPVGVWFLLRRSDKSSQSRTHTPGLDRRL